MCLATFNIRNGAAPDGAFAWPLRRDRLLTLLRELNADVFCFQEVLAFQLDEIAAALDGYAYVGVGRDDGERAGEFAPIFFRGLDLERSSTVWLSETPSVPGSIAWGARLPRICTWARFAGVMVANLHLDHESEEARIRGVGLLLDGLEADIVCGDFNAEPGEACIGTMTAAGFADTGVAGGGTFNNFQADTPGAPRIDYVFVRPPWAGKATVRREPLVSDHWPVLAEIVGTP
jgi:endonuclease/exonuclease/phosphatase family metal-dependent hydrolase